VDGAFDDRVTPELKEVAKVNDKSVGNNWDVMPFAVHTYLKPFVSWQQ
jgi:hypothetical protein